MMKYLKLLLFFFSPCIMIAQINKIMDFNGLYEIDFKTGYGEIFYEYEEDIYTIAKIDEQKLSLLNITTGMNYICVLPDTIPCYNPETFCISKDTLFFFDWQHFHAFKFKERRHLFSTILQGCPLHIKSINNTVYNFGVSFCGFLNHTNQTTVEKINLRQQNQEIDTFPNPSAHGFAFFQPSKMMDITDNQVFIADFDKYRISIYDDSKKLISCIKREPKEWVKKQDSIPKYPLGSTEPVRFINKIRPYTADRSLIKKIDLINHDKLLVAWSIPIGVELETIMRYDLWKKINGKWTLIVQDIVDFDKKDSSILNEYSIPIKYLYRIVGDYLLIKLDGATKEIFLRNQGKTFKIFKDECDQYFIDNDLKSLIGVYKIK